MGDSYALISSMAIVITWVLVVIGHWKVFEKAGEAGWKSLIPFYSTYIEYKISWGNGWLFLLLLVPIVGVIVEIVQTNKFAKSFGHGIGYTLGLLIFPEIFTIIIGFSDDQYVGPIN